MKMPRRWRISSASGVVGPLAASATTLALIRSALAGGDLVLERGRDEDVALDLEDLLVRDRLRAGEADDRAVLGLPGDDALDVEPVGVVDAARRVGDGDDRRAVLGDHQLRRDRAGVAEALDDDSGVIEVDVQVARGLCDAVDRAARRGLVAALGAAERRSACR